MIFRKWRPTFKCIYVIPELQGNFPSLEIIFNRIIPLRKHIHQEDILVMLGNYIGHHKESYKVIDCLISLKEEYKDRVILLRGKQEFLFQKALEGDAVAYHAWLSNGGIHAMQGYIESKNSKEEPLNIPVYRLNDYINKNHLKFLQNELVDSYSVDNYFFCHAGFDHRIKISENDSGNFVHDTQSAFYLKTCLQKKEVPLFKDNYIFISNFNFKNKYPLIHSNYFLLNCGAPERLCVFELNSMSASVVKQGKSRIYKCNYKVYE